MKKLLILTSQLFILSTYQLSAQNIGIGTNTPDASALLDVTSTTKGILVPRMATAQRTAIASPLKGLLVFDNNTNSFWFYNGSAWTELSASSGSGWALTGNSGTVDGVNFIGTTDDVPLTFKINNVRAGRIEAATSSAFFGVNAGSNNTGQYNTLIGTAAGSANTTGQDNTAIGSSALFANTTGQRNTALGSSALATNGIGSYNTATGYGTLRVNTSGASNVANGSYSLANNTTGELNTALGFQSLLKNTTASGNVGIGANSLYSDSTGINNTACGTGALYTNTTGATNTATGYYALYGNTTGFANVAAGFRALASNTSGYSNIAIGVRALYSNTTANNSVAVGDSALYHSNANTPYNTAVGSKALYDATTASYNTALGYQALHDNVTGENNTAVGAFAGRYSDEGVRNSFFGTFAGYSVGLNANTAFDNSIFGNEAGYNLFSGNENCIFGSKAGYGPSLTNDANSNSFFGTQAGYSLTSGDNNSYFGDYAGGNNSTGSGNVGVGNFSCEGNNINCTAVGNVSGGTGGHTNAMALGYNVYFSGDNEVRIGNNAITSIGGWANWSNVSDGRVKKNIKENVPGLSFINKLHAITYNLNLDAADEIVQRPVIKDKNGKTIQSSQTDITARSEKEQVVYSGFVAQDVEKAAKELNYDFCGVDKPKNNEGLYALRYSEFVVPLVKAVQELTDQNSRLTIGQEELKTQNNKQQQQIDELKLKLERFEKLLIKQ